MPNFSPNGILYIGDVGFDNSYRFTYLNFSNAAGQYTYFRSKMTASFDDTSYTYIRKNGRVRVQANAETLYTKNYCMYKNANYGSKWFYAFIVDCEYINDNTTELTLEIDVLQTWWFDFTLTPCFVEREHVYDDSLYKWLNSEPEMAANLVCYAKSEYTGFYPRAVIVQATEEPHMETILGQTVCVGGDPLSGKVYNGVFNGASMVAFVLEWDAINEHYSSVALEGYLANINSGGLIESVCNIFEFPANFINGLDPLDYSAQKLNDTYYAGADQQIFPRPSAVDGYTPNNNKLFTYPYSFVRVEDNNGHYVDWKWELWKDTDDGGILNPTYWVWVPLDPDATAFIIPTVYDGEAENFENALAIPITAKCSWVNEAFQNWSAQNWMGNVLGTLATGAAIAIPAAKGIKAAVALAEAQEVGTAALAGGVSTQALKQAATKATAARATMGEAGKELGMGLAGAGVGASMLSNQMMQPNRCSGAATGNSLCGIGKQTFNIKHMCYQAEFAKIADNYFDVYGYSIEQVKTPDCTGRPYWNYVKCGNANFNGSVPPDDMDLINRIFNRGITFWHTDSIGDYSLDNRAVIR